MDNYKFEQKNYFESIHYCWIDRGSEPKLAQKLKQDEKLFSPTTRLSCEMDDLDFIKRHQLQNLKMRENRDDNDSIESILHSETAGWFYLWVRQALNNLDEKDVYFHVKRVLELPSFRSARQYYEEHGSDESVPAFLMRKADPEAYIDYAKKANKEKNTDIKGVLRSTLKKIYVSI